MLSELAQCVEKCCLSSLSASSSAVGVHAVPEWSECCKLVSKLEFVLTTRVLEDDAFESLKLE